MTKPAIKVLAENVDNLLNDVGDLTNNGITDNSLAEAIKSDRVILNSHTSQLADRTTYSYVDTKVGALASDTPKGFYTTLVDLQTAFPNGDTGKYIVGAVNAEKHWYIWINNQWTDGGVYQGVGIADKSILSKHLSADFAFKARYTDVDINSIIEDGTYQVELTCPNIPIANRCVLEVVNSYHYVHQTIYQYSRPLERMTRYITKSTSTPSVWYSHRSRYVDSVTNADFNTMTKDGMYVVSGTLINSPSSATSGFLNVEVYNNYVVQRYTDFNGKTFIRNFTIGGTFTTNMWKQISYVSDYPDNRPLVGKKIVNFGDSIFGNYRPPADISTFITEKTGATTYNCGFGGCRMSAYAISYWDAFSMYQLANSIVSGNFSYQDTAIVEGSGALPSYFADTLALLKTINFNNVDYITIAYGTNDFTGSKPIENEADLDSINTFNGALRYSLEKLITAFPQLKIMVCTPIYRFWMDGSYNFTEDSDTMLANGTLLTDFVQGAKDVSKEFKIPVLDNYYDLGFNKFNRGLYFPSTDGTHPNEAGRRRIADKISSQLVTRF